MANKRRKLLKVISPIGVAAFTFLTAPDTGKKYSDDKYKGTLIVDSSDPGCERLLKLLRGVAEAEWGTVPEDVRFPFRDGDDQKVKEGEDNEFEGKTLIAFKSQYAPGFIDAKLDPLPDGIVPKAGDIVRFSGVAFPYEGTETETVVVDGKKRKKSVQYFGVTLCLKNVQLLEKRSGSSRPEDDFDQVEGYEGFKASNDNEGSADADGGPVDDDEIPF